MDKIICSASLYAGQYRVQASIWAPGSTAGLYIGITSQAVYLRRGKKMKNKH